MRWKSGNKNEKAIIGVKSGYAGISRLSWQKDLRDIRAFWRSHRREEL
jgi:hypothetical protein